MEVAVRESVFGDQAASVALLWGARDRPRSGPRPTLTLARITAAAIEIADTEGLAAVVMQRVAGKVDVTKMALYRYVPGRAELVTLMVDAAIGAPPDLAEGAGWQATLREWSRRMLDVLHRHAWLLEAMVAQRVPGPNELGWLEAGVATLADTGLDGGEALDVVFVLTGHLRNIAQLSSAAATEAASGSMLVELLVEHGAGYPALRAAVTAAASGAGQDKALDFGLARILDGVQLLITRRRQSHDVAGSSG
jgi:AcrR family transcriptional regulator